MGTSLLNGVWGKLLIAFVVFVVAAVVGWRLYEKRTVSYEFTGAVDVIEDGAIVISGHYVLPDGNAHSSGTVRAVVTPKTGFVKTVWHMLSIAELERQNWQWKPEDLRQETLAGSLEDMQEGGPVTAKASKNILGKDRFEAAEVGYLIQQYPAETRPEASSQPVEP